jgi:hypothetical protein
VSQRKVRVLNNMKIKTTIAENNNPKKAEGTKAEGRGA